MNEIAQAYEQFRVAVAAAGDVLRRIVALLGSLHRPSCPAPRPRVPMFAVRQPYTLQEAIASNVRPWRSTLPARPIRTPATRRR